MPSEVSEITRALQRSRFGRTIVRTAVCHLLGDYLSKTVPDVAREIYPDDKDLGIHTRAASTISGMTNTTALVGSQADLDFISVLGASSAVAVLFERCARMQFNGRGSIPVPGIVANAANAAFVTEGGPIPARQGAFSSVVLAPRKFAGIMEYNRELLMHSVPNIEAVVRVVMADSYSLALDAAALSTTVGDGTIVQGLRYGIAGLTPSALTVKSEALAADIEQLVTAVSVIAGNSPIIFICSAAQATVLKMLPRFPFEVLISASLAPKTAVAIATNSICSAMDATPRFKISSESTVVMDDVGAPISTSPGVFGYPIRSNYQTDTLSLRMIAEISFALRNSSGLAWLSNTLW